LKTFGIIAVIVILAIGLVGGWAGLYNASGKLEATENALEATENALLNEANFSQKQREALRELREENVELKARSDQLEGERDNLWMENVELKSNLESTLNRSIIVGRVYTDNNYNQALDLSDHIVTGNIAGFEVVLYEVYRGKVSPANKRIASTAVDNGEYMFNVEPGEYFVGVSYSSNQLYNQRYNHIIHLGNSNNIIAERGQIILGPDILLSYGSGGKG
jgi:hypothetical protein